MRTRAGHEGGTSKTLYTEIFPQGLGSELKAAVKKADHWASAADRAAFPTEEGDVRWPSWQQVRFAEQPVVIHPLTGVAHRLQAIDGDVDPEAAQALATDHLRKLVHRLPSGDLDVQRTALSLWRFGGEISGELANIWRLLPADSRVPDHTIHDHLDLTAAIAGSFVGGDSPALLGVSVGPVQDFIAAARTTSDLWAGSHLLSRLAWEAMRVICEHCGPESILFPRLRGVPQVDFWLQEVMGLDHGLFAGLSWRKTKTDANPLFAAALPNRFTAIVPTRMILELSRRIELEVREFALAKAHRALEKLLALVNEPRERGAHAGSQIDRQLEGFPEIHWTAVPWTIVGEDSAGKVDLQTSVLAQAMQPFFESKVNPGFLSHPSWQLLSRGLEIDKGWFWKPNPGSLYPALHQLLDRSLSAVKSTRTYAADTQQGWRCALTGETEWIALVAEDLSSSYRNRSDTLWARVASLKPSWARRGEHLGALPMLKRIWPEIFVEEISPALYLEGEIRRFVVSTHTMAMASLLFTATDPSTACQVPPALKDAFERAPPPRVALPKKLAARLLNHPQGDVIRRLPGWIEAISDAADREGESEDAEGSVASCKRQVETMLGGKSDAYYGLLLLDGDRMGAWLAADATLTRPVAESFHPQIRQRLDSRFGGNEIFLRYSRSGRAPNPAWHMAISEALNHFALLRAPQVIEEQHLGRLIYAGGDDVLAMLAASDLMAAADSLRKAYSGIGDEQEATEAKWRQTQGNGWALHKGRILRMMGTSATASCGLVIAHHQAPLSSVMRHLRAAEVRAKESGGRNAWSLTLVKRSGGLLQVTAKWDYLALFEDLRFFLASEAVSRRAAYSILDWIADVPTDVPSMITAILAYRLERQSQSANTRAAAPQLAKRLVEAACYQGIDSPRQAGNGLADTQGMHVDLRWLSSFMLASEFMAREVRQGRNAESRPLGESI